MPPSCDTTYTLIAVAQAAQTIPYSGENALRMAGAFKRCGVTNASYEAFDAWYRENAPTYNPAWVHGTWTEASPDNTPTMAWLLDAPPSEAPPSHDAPSVEASPSDDLPVDDPPFDDQPSDTPGEGTESTQAKPTNLTNADLRRLETESWIDRATAELFQLERVSDAQGRAIVGIHTYSSEDYAGIAFTTFSFPTDKPDGGPPTRRREQHLRRDNPPLEKGKEIRKYLAPLQSRNVLLKGPLDTYDDLRNVDLVIIFVEGWKKLLAMQRLARWQTTTPRFLVVGLNGVYGWRGTTGHDVNAHGATVPEKGPLNDFGHILVPGRVALALFDSDTTTNPKVAAARRGFVAYLTECGLRVGAPDLPTFANIDIVGPDNLLARWGPRAVLDWIDGHIRSVSGPSEWADPHPVKAELLPVPALPLDIVPAVLRDWVRDASNRMQCPPDFIAAALLVLAGSLIGAGCAIRPKQQDDWSVVPNLWGTVIGRPSMLKTPAILEAMNLLNGLEATAKEVYDKSIKEYLAKLEVHKARKEALKEQMRLVAKGVTKKGDHLLPSMASLEIDFAKLEAPLAPTWRRYRTNDPTIEKMGDLQAQNPRGLLLFRDELTGLLRSWDRENHQADRAYYLEAWNGVSPYTTDRIGRGTIHVDNLCVSLFGGIQPMKLCSYLSAAMRGPDNDGLVQRLQMMVYPNESSDWELVDTQPDQTARTKAADAVSQLAAMDFRKRGAFGDEGQGIPYYRFDEAGQAVFYEWLKALEEKLRATDEDEPIIAEHLGKYRSLMPSLALIFHCLDLSQDATAPLQISQVNAERAAAWCGYLEAHARRVYGLVTDATAQAASRLAEKIRKNQLPDPFTLRDIYRKSWTLLDQPMAKKAVDELVSLGWLKEVITPPAMRQRGKVEYFLNPKVRDHG